MTDVDQMRDRLAATTSRGQCLGELQQIQNEVSTSPTLEDDLTWEQAQSRFQQICDGIPPQNADRSSYDQNPVAPVSSNDGPVYPLLSYFMGAFVISSSQTQSSSGSESLNLENGAMPYIAMIGAGFQFDESESAQFRLTLNTASITNFFRPNIGLRVSQDYRVVENFALGAFARIHRYGDWNHDSGLNEINLYGVGANLLFWHDRLTVEAGKIITTTNSDDTDYQGHYTLSLGFTFPLGKD